MGKLTSSVKGTVKMADGTRRGACRNTYQATVFDADGGFELQHEERVEFELFTAAGRRPAYRKTSAKQAATFVAN
jgi:hypothetical protein